eukprot:16110451-Heterocapsa_arctica.AAC.1
MMAHPQYTHYTVQKKIDEMSHFIAGMTWEERKELSKMGAVRLSRKEALKFVRGYKSSEFIYSLMMITKVGDQDDCVGYILYEDVGNQLYAVALKECIAPKHAAMWLGEEKKGDVVECIMALGYIYQTAGYMDLEGIMDLVVYIENKIRAPDMPERITERKKDAQDTLNMSDDLQAMADSVNSKLDYLTNISRENNERIE